MPLKLGLAALAILSLTAVSATKIDRSSDAGEATKQPEVQVRGPIVGTSLMVDFDEQYELEQVKIAEYLAAEAIRIEAERLEAERQAELQRQAEAAAARRQAPSVPTIRTGTSGPHSDAWWWGVAICEQGGRNDPYYGYFSWMDGSAAGLTWEQQVAKSNALLASVSSESPAWAPSCVAAGYAASPGG